jgi:hypothetical protein
MPNQEPIKLPSGAKFAKTVGENPNYYLIINDGNGSFSSRIASLTKADIIELYQHIMSEPKEKYITMHVDTWQTCTCEGCTIFRETNNPH